MRRSLGSEKTSFDKTRTAAETQRIELYLLSPDALAKAHRHFGGSQGLLARAAQSVADAGRGNDGKSSGQSIDDEVGALKRFLSEAKLEMDAAAIGALLAANAMKSGEASSLLPTKPFEFLLQGLPVGLVLKAFATFFTFKSQCKSRLIFFDDMMD